MLRLVTLFAVLATALAAIQWCKHPGKYLSGYATGRKHNKFDALSTAKKSCRGNAGWNSWVTRLLWSPDCGGVTYEPSTLKYTTRQGPELQESPASNSGEISWVECQEEEEEEWCEHVGKHLKGYSAGRKKFPTLINAQQQCVNRKDCAGVTYEPSSRKYTLRKDTTLHDSPSDAEITWIVCEKAPCVDNEPQARYCELFLTAFKGNCVGNQFEDDLREKCALSCGFC